jgi:hypothetical protein
MLREELSLKVALWSEVVDAVAPAAAAAAAAAVGSDSNSSSTTITSLKGVDVLLVDVHADLPLLYRLVSAMLLYEVYKRYCIHVLRPSWSAAAITAEQLLTTVSCPLLLLRGLAACLHSLLRQCC